eukprot:g1860.t1
MAGAVGGRPAPAKRSAAVAGKAALRRGRRPVPHDPEEDEREAEAPDVRPAEEEEASDVRPTFTFSPVFETLLEAFVQNDDLLKKTPRTKNVASRPNRLKRADFYKKQLDFVTNWLGELRNTARNSTTKTPVVGGLESSNPRPAIRELVARGKKLISKRLKKNAEKKKSATSDWEAFGGALFSLRVLHTAQEELLQKAEKGEREREEDVAAEERDAAADKLATWFDADAYAVNIYAKPTAWVGLVAPRTNKNRKTSFRLASVCDLSSPEEIAVRNPAYCAHVEKTFADGPLDHSALLGEALAAGHNGKAHAQFARPANITRQLEVHKKWKSVPYLKRLFKAGLLDPEKVRGSLQAAKEIAKMALRRRCDKMKVVAEKTSCFGDAWRGGQYLTDVKEVRDVARKLLNQNKEDELDLMLGERENGKVERPRRNKVFMMAAAVVREPSVFELAGDGSDEVLNGVAEKRLSRQLQEKLISLLRKIATPESDSSSSKEDEMKDGVTANSSADSFDAESAKLFLSEGLRYGSGRDDADVADAWKNKLTEQQRAFVLMKADLAKAQTVSGSGGDGGPSPDAEVKTADDGAAKAEGSRSNDPADQHQLSGGMIALIVVLCLVFVASVTVLLCVWRLCCGAFSGARDGGTGQNEDDWTQHYDKEDYSHKNEYHHEQDYNIYEETYTSYSFKVEEDAYEEPGHDEPGEQELVRDALSDAKLRISLLFGKGDAEGAAGAPLAAAGDPGKLQLADAQDHDLLLSDAYVDEEAADTAGGSRNSVAYTSPAVVRLEDNAGENTFTFGSSRELR